MHSNRKVFGFNIFRNLGNFTKTIYFDELSLKQTMDKKDEIESLLRNLGGYKPKNLKKQNLKKKSYKIHINFLWKKFDCSCI